MNGKPKQFLPDEETAKLNQETAALFAASLHRAKRPLAEICTATRDERRCIDHHPKLLAAWCKAAGVVTEQNPLLRAAVLLKCSRNELPLQWLCGQVGGVFVRDATRYARKQWPSSMSADIGEYPELAEWLSFSVRIGRLKIAIHELACRSPIPQGGSAENDALLKVVAAWLSAQGWMEGYLEWTGSEGNRMAHPGRPTAAAQAVPCHALLKTALADHPSTTESPTRQTAAGLGLSESSIHKWQEECVLKNGRRSGSATPFDHLASLSHATDSVAMVEWLCEFMNGSLRNAEAGKVKRAKPWPQIFWEITELEYTASRALIDGDVDPQEALKVRAEWKDVKDWMAELLSAKARRGA